MLALAALAVSGLAAYTIVDRYWKGPIPESAWVEFSPREGRCRVKMPGLPVEREVHRGPGVVNAKTYTVIRKREDVAFYLSYYDKAAQGTKLTPSEEWRTEAFQELYAAKRDYYLGWADGKLTHEMDLEVPGRMGKEFQADLAERGLLRVRIYLVPGKPYDRRYILLVGGTLLRTEPEAAGKFFDSFTIEETGGS